MRRLGWILALTALAAPARADLLETRDGRVLEGTFLGGTEQALRFKVGDGVEVFLVEEVVQVRFTGPPTRAGARAPAGATSLPARAPAPPAARPAAALAAKPAPAPSPAATPAPAASVRPPKAHPPAAPTPPPTPSAPVVPAPPAAPAAPRLARVEAGTRLRVRMVDGIDSRTAVVGDRFAASLETGLGLDGVAILPAGTKLYGQVAELRATGPVATRLKLELTQLMLQGQLMPIVTGPHQLAETESAGPARASTIPARPGVGAGSVLEFRLLQPFELRIP